MAKAATTQQGLRLEAFPLSRWKVAARNPKKHLLPDLKLSLQRFGFVEPALMDERTGRLIAGHGRREALLELQAAGGPPPRFVEQSGKEWLVPVTRGWRSKDDTEAEALLVALNNLPAAGGWDPVGLAQMLTELSQANALEGLGFSDKALDEALRQLSPPPEEEPHVIELPKDPYVKLGDLWALGSHRIICGDSTNPETVQCVLLDDTPQLMVTDPPYGVEYDPSWRTECGVGEGSDVTSAGKVENDDQVDWSAAYRLFPGAVAYVWHAGVFAGQVQEHLEREQFDVRAQIIWAKPHAAIGRGAYHWQHEPCWYAVRRGANANWHGDRKQTTVWSILPPKNGFIASRDPADERTGHGTQKPVEAYRRPLVNHTRAGDSLYEPFSGSGTAIIACEQLGRLCRAVELSPVYVQVAIERWQKFTGKTAERVG